MSAAVSNVYSDPARGCRDRTVMRFIKASEIAQYSPSETSRVWISQAQASMLVLPSPEENQRDR